MPCIAVRGRRGGFRSGGIFWCPQLGLRQTAVLMSLHPKSQVAVIYRFTNTCCLCTHFIAVYYLCELSQLVQTCFKAKPLEKTYPREARLSMSSSSALACKTWYSNVGCVRQLVTCLWSCARLALCLEVVDGSWLLWFTGNSTCVLCASQWTDS